MAKVFAVERNASGDMVLREWASKADFNRSESWIDDRWLAITDTQAGREYYYGTGMLQFLSDDPAEQQAHQMLLEAFAKHYKGKPRFESTMEYGGHCEQPPM